MLQRTRDLQLQSQALGLPGVNLKAPNPVLRTAKIRRRHM